MKIAANQQTKEKLNKEKKETTQTKFITAQQAEMIYGVKAKTLLNRSGLPQTDRRYLPSLNLKGGRRKYFERKLLDRLFIVTSTHIKEESND